MSDVILRGLKEDLELHFTFSLLLILTDFLYVRNFIIMRFS